MPPPPIKSRSKKRARAGQIGPETVSGLEHPPEMSETYAAADNPVVSANASGDVPQEHVGDSPILQLGSSSMASSPSEEDIRMRAYQLYRVAAHRNSLEGRGNVAPAGEFAAEREAVAAIWRATMGESV